MVTTWTKPENQIKIPKLETSLIDIDLIKPYPKNAKDHPQTQINKIKLSIEKYGFRVPLILNNQKNKEVVTGHGRLLAAKELNMKNLPVIYADDLSPEEIKAFRIVDNKVTESEWMMDYLKEEMDELKDTDFSGFFDLDQIQHLNEEIIKEPEFDENMDLTKKCPSCGYEW